MIGDGEKYHYLTVTNLSGFLEGNSSHHKGDFYCLNCFNSYTSENKLKEHEEICNNHDSCHIEMPERVNKILKHNLGEKSLEAPFAIYLDLECIFKKLQSIQNNPEKSYTEKKLDMSLLLGQCLQGVHLIKDKRGKDCIEKLCKDLEENATKIIDYEKKDDSIDS